MDSIEIIKRTEDKVLAVYQWAELNYARKFELPHLRFDVRGLMAGLAYPKRNLIRFNMDLLRANAEDFITETVPHEIAHLLTWTINGLGAKPHGPEWKAVMGPESSGLPRICCESGERGNSENIFLCVLM